MLKKLYEWMLDKAGHPQAAKWLAGISFAESSFFPIPPDVMLAPMCLAKPERSWWYALVCTIASVLGASPGASTAVPIMIEVLRRCFPGRELDQRVREMLSA